VAELSRSQLFVYAAVAIALLLVGARAVRAANDDRSSFATPAAAAPEVGFSVSSDGADLVVDVAGAVRDPGVYRLPSGARVVDAIRRAGGPANGALLAGINRAARLVDGQQVVVPERVPAAATAAAAGSSAEAGPISLGSATLEQLDTIDGIGPVTAQKIIEYRDQNGGLASVDQLDQVSGIGPATMESLRARLQP
jgi:competence protein ComEA